MNQSVRKKKLIKLRRQRDRLIIDSIKYNQKETNWCDRFVSWYDQETLSNLNRQIVTDDYIIHEKISFIKDQIDSIKYNNVVRV